MPVELVMYGADSGTNVRDAAVEVLSLGRLNWNTSDLRSSQPVTLGFARRVGGIMAEYGLFEEEDLILAFASLPAAFLWPRVLSNKGVTWFVIALCAGGISAGLVLVASDLAFQGAIEWHVVALRLIHVGALVVLVRGALARTGKTTA